MTITKGMDNTQLTVLVNELANQIEGLKHLHKTIFTSEEVAEYTGLKKSYVDKLCSQRKIPFYQPRGKMKYFKREDIDRWLLKNRIDTIDERFEKSVC